MRTVHHIAAATLLAFSVTLLPFVTIFAPNVREFSDSSVDLAVPYVVGFVAISTALVAVSKLTRNSALLFLLYVCMATMFTVVSQLFGDAPILDGSPVRFDTTAGRALVEAGVLVGVAVFFVYSRRQLLTAPSFVLAIVGLWMAAATAVSFAQYESRKWSDPNSLLELSSELNIVHVMFDSLQTDAFLATLRRNAQFAPMLDGFVHYTNHAGYSNWTTLSLPAILAGRFYFEEPERPGERATVWFKRTLNDDSLPVRLAAQGFDTAALLPSYCAFLSFPCFYQGEFRQRLDPAGYDNSLLRADGGDGPILLQWVFVRLVPSMLKEKVYRRGPGFLKPANDEVASGIDLAMRMPAHVLGNLRVADSKPRYRFLHFFPPHKPFVLKSDCALRGDPQQSAPAGEWQLYEEQATCAVRQFMSLVQRLKALGIYDRTIVILQADTGLGMVSSENSSRETISRVVGYTREQLVAYARPVLLIKGLGDRAPYRESSVPTHHRDTFRLIMEASGGTSGGRLQLPVIPTEGDRPFHISDAVRLETIAVEPYDRFLIGSKVDEFDTWTSLGVRRAGGEPARKLRPIKDLKLSLSEKGPLTVGDRITLRAKVVGGESRQQFLFFYRGKDSFQVIQNWSPSPSATFAVPADSKDRCSVALIVAAYNVGASESAAFDREVSIPLSNPNCARPN